MSAHMFGKLSQLPWMDSWGSLCRWAKSSSGYMYSVLWYRRPLDSQQHRGNKTSWPLGISLDQQSTNKAVVQLMQGNEICLRKTTYIPNLKLDLLLINLDDPGTELHPDCVRTWSHELLLRELV